MRLNQFFIFLILTQLLSAQSFTEASPIPPFDGVELAHIAFADVDGDNDDDVLIAGSNGTARISKLYINDGRGAFTEMTNTPFQGVTRGAVGFADVDGDSDYDVLIAGAAGSTLISKLYTNDGGGNFTEVIETPFEAVHRCSVGFADVDGDNDLDVLIVGQTKVFRSSKLYTNDGSGEFTEKTGTPFEAVENGSVTFADVDGDNDNDVLITGTNGSKSFSNLYINDGSGNFTKKADTPFDPVTFSFQGVVFADVDGDSDGDVLISGKTSNPSNYISKLYINDGFGTYSEKADTPFDGVSTGSNAFADVDDDGDLDVLITGFNNSDAPSTKLYLNDGNGTFTEMTDAHFESVAKSSIAFADVDGDSDNDVLISGVNGSGNPISKLYINNLVVSSSDKLKNTFDMDFMLFPNPSTSNSIFLKHNLIEFGKVAIKVYDQNGVLIRRQTEYAVPGRETISFDITSLVQGIYFIELDNGIKRGVAKFMVR